MYVFLIFICSLLSGCAWKPSSADYRHMYAHLECLPEKKCCCEDDFYIVFLVDARHLDYTDNRSLCKTLAKHPSDGSKNGDVGHAWVYLHGIIDGQEEIIEGGHSGELAFDEPKYLDGMMTGIENGDPNPVHYLWKIRHDGFFQEGSGKHIPTFAAKVSISEEQFYQIRQFIQEYEYQEYAITEDQCASFVVKIGELIEFQIANKLTMQIDQEIWISGEKFVLWHDPRYSYITFSSPDVVEKSLIEAVKEGRAENVLSWYKKTHPRKATEALSETCEAIRYFPSRICRLLVL